MTFTLSSNQLIRSNPRSISLSAVAVVTLMLCGCGDDTTADTTSTGASGGLGGAGGAQGGEGGTGGVVGGEGGAPGGGGQGGGGMGGECQNSLDPEEMPPAVLSDTALYSDIATKTIAANIDSYAPLYPLWSDGAEKNRWVYLPECEQIDTSDMDQWEFPVGTRLFKEFINGAGKRLETRLIHRWGPGADEWNFVSYQWNDEETEATLAPPEGVLNVDGAHDIPSTQACIRCHGGMFGQGGTPSRVNGFGALQLSHANTDVSMATLSADNKLTVPAPNGFAVPGTGADQAVLGYLHGNCGICHNTTSFGIAFVPMKLTVSVDDALVEDTNLWTTAIDQVTVSFMAGSLLIDSGGAGPGVPGNSALLTRISSAPPSMPPIGVETANTVTNVVISDWIQSL